MRYSKYSNIPKDGIHCFLLVLLIIISLTVLYFIGVYLLYGIVILSHSDYNTTTGCPNNNPDCEFDRLQCYQNNMSSCYILAIPILIASVILVDTIVMICYYQSCSLCTKKK